MFCGPCQLVSAEAPSVGIEMSGAPCRHKTSMLDDMSHYQPIDAAG